MKKIISALTVNYLLAVASSGTVLAASMERISVEIKDYVKTDCFNAEVNERITSFALANGETLESHSCEQTTRNPADNKITSFDFAISPTQLTLTVRARKHPECLWLFNEPKSWMGAKCILIISRPNPIEVEKEKREQAVKDAERAIATKVATRGEQVSRDEAIARAAQVAKKEAARDTAARHSDDPQVLLNQLTLDAVAAERAEATASNACEVAAQAALNASNALARDPRNQQLITAQSTTMQAQVNSDNEHRGEQPLYWLVLGALS